MLPLLRSILHAFFQDELAFRRWARGLMLAFAGGGLAFAEQIASVIEAPGAVKKIKVASIVAGFIAGAMQSSAKKAAEPQP